MRADITQTESLPSDNTTWGERRGFSSYNFAYLFGSLNGDMQQRALIQSLIKEIHLRARRRWEKERQRREGGGPRLFSDGSRCSGWVDGKMGRASFCRRCLHWEQVFSGAMPKWAPGQIFYESYWDPFQCVPNSPLLCFLLEGVTSNGIDPTSGFKYPLAPGWVGL